MKKEGFRGFQRQWGHRGAQEVAISLACSEGFRLHFSILKRIIFLVAKIDILWLNKNYSQLIELIRFSKERTAIMKKQYCFLLVLAILMAIPLSPVGAIHAQQTTSLEVAAGTVCQDVVNRQPIDVGNSFEASVGTLYCLTKITGASGPTQITHV